MRREPARLRGTILKHVLRLLGAILIRTVRKDAIRKVKWRTF